MTTYECSICYAVNHSSRLHCGYCGTIPKAYSLIGREAIIHESDTLAMFIPINPAIGCDRTERHRTCKRILRTVSADYYALE